MSEEIKEVRMWAYNGNLYKDHYAAVMAAFRNANPYYLVSEAQSKMDLKHNELSNIDKQINDHINTLKTKELDKKKRCEIKSRLYGLYASRIDNINRYKGLKKDYYELLKLYKESMKENSNE